MNLSSELCWTGADNAFGPTVHGCRGDFDFTLTFEQAFFSLAPSAVVVIASAARLPYLLRREKLVEANAFKWLKVVRAYSQHGFAVFSSRPGNHRRLCCASAGSRFAVGDETVRARARYWYRSRGHLFPCCRHPLSAFSA